MYLFQLRDNRVSISDGGGATSGGGGSGGSHAGDGDLFGMIFGSGAAVAQLSPPNIVLLSFLIYLILYITTNRGGSL